VLRVLIAMLALAGAWAPSATADSYSVDRLLAISGFTPWPGGCGVTGTQTSDSEAEPYIAVNPTDSKNIVAVYQQDRFPMDGGALSDLAAVTKDGGATWSTVQLPGISRCTGGGDERASDPWISFGGDGRAYYATLSFVETPAGTVGAAGPTNLAVSTSTDGGLTWGNPVSVIADGAYNDREAVTADPKRPGTAYVVWVKRLGALGESGIEYFKRTTDGGQTWSAAAPIYTPIPGRLPDPILVNVLPDGSLLNTFVVIDSKTFTPAGEGGRWEIDAQRSTDQGASWSGLIRIGDTASVSPSDPDSGTEVRALPIISTAVGPDGTAYVAWNDIKSTTDSLIRLSRSTDGGRSWSAPRNVAEPPAQAFLPSLAVGADGTLGVTWDDFRNDVSGDGKLTTDVWFAHSHDDGATWSESHLAGPFDVLTASQTVSTEIAGRFVGDYQGLVALPSGFAGIFAQAKPQATAGPSDTFFARLSAGGAGGGPGSRGRGAAGRGPRIHLRVRPRRVRAGGLVRLVFRAYKLRGRKRIALRRVRITFAGRHARTSRHGRAVLRVRLHRTGLRRARGTRSGFRRGTVRVRVLPRRGSTVRRPAGRGPDTR
jgi:hypothetical protein